MLRDYYGCVPNVPHMIVYEFTKYLAERLEPCTTPLGFVSRYLVCLEELERGERYDTKTSLEHPLARKHKSLYRFLQSQLPKIGNRVFPIGFAREVEKVTQGMETNLIPRQANT